VHPDPEIPESVLGVKEGVSFEGDDCIGVRGGFEADTSQALAFSPFLAVHEVRSLVTTLLDHEVPRSVSKLVQSRCFMRSRRVSVDWCS